MKPHRHAEIIKEFVNGKECEYHIPYADKWEEINFLADFDTRHTVRVKPEKKLDIVAFAKAYCFENNMSYLSLAHTDQDDFDNLKLIFDGETNVIKSAEVIK
jgi:hypothetical protein